MQAAAVMSSLGLRRLSAETRLTLLLFAFSFFISGVPRVYTQTAAHTLFLNAYGSAAMPYAYLAEALCVPLAGWLYMLAERRTSFRRLVIGTLGVDILVQVGFRLAIWLQLPFAAAGTIVWFEVEFVLSSLLLWGLANSLMTLRQGKRLFGFVSAGEPVAVIVCGITTPMLMDWLEPADLFLFSALGAAIGMLLVLVITARFQPVEAAAPDGAESTDDNGKQSAPRPWWKNGFIVTLVAVVFVSQLGYFFVDNAFYMEAAGRYPAESDLASFLGLYSAVMGVISLICSVGLAGPLVSRFGVRGGLLTLPLLLTMGALAAVVCGHLGGGLNTIFWLVVLNKVIDQAFRYTLDKTNSVTLYQPLPARQRTQVQAGLESMVEPLSGGVAGLALYALLNWFGFTAFHVTHVIAIVAGLWTVGVFVQHRGYLGALRQALAGRRLQDAALLLDDVEAVNCLRQGLACPHAGTALYSLELLDGTDWRPTADEMAGLLVHPAPEVRLDVARRVERGRLSLAIDQITARLSVEAAPEVRGALIEALSAAPLPDPIGSLAPYLDDPDPAARLGAYSGLIRHGGIEGVMEVGGRLIAAQSDTDPAARQFVARVIERVGSPQLYRPLLALLADPNPAVRGSALHAVGRVGTPRVWPAVFDNLDLATTRQRAIAALVAIGEPVLDEATARFAQPAASYPLRRDLIAVCGRIGSPAAFDWLLRLVEHPDRRLKGDALNALWRCRRKASSQDHPMLRHALLGEVADAGEILAMWDGLAAGDERSRLVQSALEAELAGLLDNLFCLLALLLDGVDMREARSNYQKGGPVRRAYVIEMLDNALDRPLKDVLLPFLEAETTEERARRARPEQQHNWASGPDVCRAMVLQPEGRRRDWTRSCALYALSADAATKEASLMLTIEKVLVLRSVSIFAEVNAEYLSHLAASAEDVEIAAGQPLFREGDFGTALYVIVRGRLRVHLGDTTLAELGEREVVGEMAALDPEPRSASVSAIEDSLLLRITHEDLELLLSDDVEVARGIIQVLCRRLRQSANPQPAARPAEPAEAMG